MVTRKSVIALFLTILVVSTLPATVMAQQVPRAVLFDEDTRQVASVTVDGQTYEVYRIENVVWYASGVDIYADGDRVRSESTARAVLTKLARRRAIQDFGPEDVTRLRRLKRNVSDVASVVANASGSIDRTLTHLERLKTKRVDNTTAYRATLQAAPQVRTFNDTARDLLPQLRSYDRDSEAFVENATTLIRLVEQRSNGSSVDPERLYTVYLATVRANDALSNHLGFGGMNDGLSDVAGLSATIAQNVSGVPEYGNETAAHFERVETTAMAATNQTETIELLGFDFEETQDHARSFEAELMDDWRSRQNAGTDVYYTLSGLGLLAVAAAGYFRWR